MDLYDAMRTTFSARQFTDEPVPDSLLAKVLENARFAPNGGNRQGHHVIIVREQATKDRIAELAIPTAKRYSAQNLNGESPWNPVDAPKVSAEQIDATPTPPGLVDPYHKSPVLLVVCVDLRVVAAVDQLLDRVAVVPGASIYPFAWNILLALRNEGFGGTLTTMPIGREPELKALLGIPEPVAVAAVIPVGRPVRQLTKLRRHRVEQFTTLERWDGRPLAQEEDADE